MIPMFALVLALLYGFRRYFFVHLIFSAHVYAFILGWLLAAGITISLMLRLIGALSGNTPTPS
jgi:hypothetical protein